MERTQDIVVGLLFALLGSGAAWTAMGYSGATGVYPMLLGIVLTVLGIGLAFSAATSGRRTERPLVQSPGRVVRTLAIAALYVWAVGRIGFFTSSILLMLALPPALGFRRPVFLVIAALLFVAATYLVFVVLLEKPLPPEIWRSL